MKKTMILTVGCTFFACLASVGFAQEPGRAQMMDKLFERLDQNQNGSIDADEVPEKLKARLGAADANNDGKIEKAELAAMQQQGKGEQQKGGQQKGDRRPDAQGERNGRPEKGRPENGANQQRPQERLQQIMAKVDQNQDGKISVDEAPERMKQNFAQIDSNGDQFVDQKELQAMFAKIMQGAGEKGAGQQGKKGRGDKGKKGRGDKGERNPGQEGPAPRQPRRPADA